MDGSSRLLRVLVAGVLAMGVGGNANAAPTDLATIKVWGFTQGGWVIGSAGGGGGYWGGASTSQPTAEEYCMYHGFGCEDFLPTCPSVLMSAPSGCDLNNPPPRTADGCGAGPTAGIVPDFLVVNGVGAAFGNIFTEACNAHDHCYGEFKSGKHRCDAQLEVDMIAHARDRIPTAVWPVFEPHVRLQAAAFRVALEQPPIAWIAQSAYTAAQNEGKCRSVALAAAEYGCLP